MKLAATRSYRKDISKEQKKIIYTLGQALGLVDRSEEKDLLHTLIESMTGKNHVSELSVQEATQVIDRLKGNMKGTDRIQSTKSKAAPVHRPGMASDGQIRMIWRQMYLLRDYDPPGANKDLKQRLRGFLKKYAGIDDIQFLTVEKANNVIEGLKGTVASEKARARKLS